MLFCTAVAARLLLASGAAVDSVQAQLVVKLSIPNRELDSETPEMLGGT